MNCGQVSTTLWIGPCPAADSGFEQLKSLGITAILSLQSSEDLRERGEDWAPAMAQRFGFVYRNVPITDFDQLDLLRRMARAVESLDDLMRAGNAVYLHCTAGVSRSATVAAAYLHWRGGCSLDEALDRVRKCRNCVRLGDLIRRAASPPWSQESV